MASSTRTQLENWLRTIEVSGKHVLDVGGAQNPVKGRTKSWDVDEYQVMDLPEPHQENGDVSWYADIQLPWSAQGSGAEMFFEAAGMYDVIFCLEVMEYVYLPQNAVDHMRDMLAEGGTLYISFPFVYPVHAPHGEDCMRYTRYGARKLLEYYGLVVDDVTPRVATTGSLSAFYKQEGMRPLRKYEGSHEETGYLVTARKPYASD